MSSCAECGREIPPAAGSCTRCGAPLPQVDEPPQFPPARPWPPAPSESPPPEFTWRLLPPRVEPPPPAASQPPPRASREPPPPLVIGTLPPDASETWPPADGGPWPPPAGGPWRPPARRPPPRRRAIVVAAAVVAALAGLAAWLLIRQPAGRERPAAQSSVGAGQRGTTGPASPSSPAAPSQQASTPRARASNTDAVALGASATRQPGAHHIAAFLVTYFAAINKHDYRAYIRLFDPQARPINSRQQFVGAFRSTRDSGAKLVGISPTATGPAAEITFDSHQRPADSATQTACTTWRITLFLEAHGRAYLIGGPPAGYHAQATPCR
jgi:hypothetical protein